MRRPLGADLGATVARYSTVAAGASWPWPLTGVQQAWIRLGSIDGLFTAYGVVVALKTVAIVVLGVLGWLHRRNIVEVLAKRPGDGRVVRPARGRRARGHGRGDRAGGRAGPQRAPGARRGAGAEPRPRAERLPRPRADGRRRLVHRLAHRLALRRHGRARRGALPRRGRAAAPSRRRLAGRPHHLLGARLGPVRLGHLQRARHLGPGAVQHAHGHAHGRGDDRAAAPRARGAADPRAAGAQGPPRQDVGAARGAAPGGALTGDAGAGQPGRGGILLLLQPGGVLLDRPVPAVADHPHRAPADDGPLPDHRVTCSSGCSSASTPGRRAGRR